jgi:adenine-specific DNA-methyltransferase
MIVLAFAAARDRLGCTRKVQFFQNYRCAHFLSESVKYDFQLLFDSVVAELIIVCAQMNAFKKAVEILGEPYYKTDTVAIYNRDCVAALKLLPAGLVDLTVTSPPYNIGKEYETNMALTDYIAWCKQWLVEVARVSHSSGSFWLNLGYVPVPDKGKAVPLPYMLWNICPMFLVQEVVWHYGAGVAARNSLSPRNEKFLWYVNDQNDYTFNLDAIRDPNVKYPNQKKGGVLRCNPLGKNPSDVWIVPKVTSGQGRASSERTAHPAQFPVAVIERIIKGCSNESELILDPFLGSGTTAEVASRTSRYCIGFEIDTSYCAIAKRRLINSRQTSDRVLKRPQEKDEDDEDDDDYKNRGDTNNSTKRSRM